MPEFSTNSMKQLDTCDFKLQALFHKVIMLRDCTIIEGHRDAERQNEMVRQGRSKLSWPDSRHNSSPSRAVDVGPYYPGEGIPWDDRQRFIFFAGYVFGVADDLRIPVRWGGDWDSDLTFTDQSFHDLPHWELVEEDL
jgi:peptidoglycan L-alanyl-D-glutamate endopeptidase CwlK